jgi:hypothetical protein
MNPNSKEKMVLLTGEMTERGLAIEQVLGSAGAVAKIAGRSQSRQKRGSIHGN